MKKTILITAFAMALGIALVPAAAPAQAATKYLDTGTTTYEKYDGAWVKSSVVTSAYNKKGMQTSYAYKYYDSTTGKVMGSFTIKHTYDKKGRVKTMKDYSDGKLSSRSVYTYKKKKSVAKNYNGKKYTGKTVTTVSGKKSVNIDYNAKGKKVGKSILVTDKKGNIKSHKVYEKGKLAYKTVNTIKKGKIVKSMHYSYEKGKLTRTTKTTYSYSGNYTTEKTYESGVLEYESKYFTEKKTGRHVSVWTKSYYEGKLMSSMTFKAEKFTSGKQKGLVKQLNGYADGELVQKQVYSVKVL